MVKNCGLALPKNLIFYLALSSREKSLTDVVEAGLLLIKNIFFVAVAVRGAIFPADCEERQAASATKVKHHQRVDHIVKRDRANGAGPGHPL